MNVHAAEIPAEPRVDDLTLTSSLHSHLRIRMTVVMKRDFAARCERNRQHSADGSQNDRPDDETADNHNLKREERRKGETG